MKTKILAMFIAFSMILTIASATAANSNTESIFSNAEAQQVLVDLGFIQNDIDGEFHPEAQLTRADFAYMAIKMNGGLLSGKSEEELKAKYADYYSFEREAQAADAAIESGYMAMYSDGLFRPNESVYYKDIIRLCINSLGYNLYEGLYGVSDTSYLEIMAKLPYLRRLNLNMEEAAKRGTAAYIIYETLNQDMVRTVSYGTYKTYEIQKGYTIFTEILKIKKTEGRVEANEFTHIDHTDGLNKGKIKINGIIFNAPNVFGLLGYDVKAYYSTESDENEILSIVKKTTEDDETVIFSEDIKEYQNGNLYFQSGNKPQNTINITPKADIIYNGVAYPNFNDEIFNIDFGEVRIINNSKGEQTVLITNYEVVIVSLADYTQQVIYDKYDTNKIVNYGYYGKNCLFLDENGYITSEISITAGNAILVAKSADNSFIMIKRPNIKTSGHIQELTKENERTIEIVIGQRSYAIAKSARGEYAITLAPNVAVTFFLERGIVVAFGEAVYDEGMKIGYLVEAGMFGSGLSKGLQLKIFTDDGQMKVFDCESKIRVDDNYVKSNDAEVISEVVAEKEKVIRYTINPAGKITEIDLPYSDTPKSDEDAKRLRLDYKTATKLTYRSAQRSFYGKTHINNNTVIFGVPNSGAEEYYTVLAMDDLISGSGYVFESYVLGPEIGISSAIVFRFESNSISESVSNVSVVDKITSILDDDNNSIYKLDAYDHQSGNVSILVTDANVLDGIQQGDIIRWSSYNGRAHYIEKIFDAATMTQKLYTTTAYHQTLSLFHWKVYSYNDGLYQMTTKTDMENVTRADLTGYNLQNTTIYVFDSANKRLLKGSLGDVHDYRSTGKYSEIFMYGYLGTPRLFVVYK